jgi:toxin CptA
MNSASSDNATVELRLQPSLKALKLISTLHVLPLAALPFAMQPGPALWALIAAFAGSWFWLRRHPVFGFGPTALVRLIWHADGRWTVQEAQGASYIATLRSDSSQHPMLLVLRYELEAGGVRTRTLFGDETDADALRRLRARLLVTHNQS